MVKYIGSFPLGLPTIDPAFWHNGWQIIWHRLPSPGQSLIACSQDRPDLLQDLLEEFNNLFAEPQGLPPQRTWDHRITLQPDTLPIVARPYCYTYAQKYEPEKQCIEMLLKGVYSSEFLSILRACSVG